LPAPVEDQAYMRVSALEAGSLTFPQWWIVNGIPPRTPGLYNTPSLSFYLEHSKSGKKVIFDLGIPKDLTILSPFTQNRIGPGKDITVDVSRGVVEDSLKAAGIDPGEIDVVVLSHAHWDHIGDQRPFTKATFIVGSETHEILDYAYPQNKDSAFVSSLVPAGRTRYIGENDGDWTSPIGPWEKAHDLFGDGSMYILYGPGHLQGHICLLARTSAEGSWIVLTGDAAHDERLISGERDIAQHADDGCGKPFCMHVNPTQARETIAKLGIMYYTPKVHVQIAHKAVDDSYYYPGRIPAKK